MKRIALLALMLFATAAPASDYAYNAADGFYYKDSLPYTRTEVWNPGYSYYQYGRCYTSPGYYSYSYQRYYPPAAPVVKVVEKDDQFDVLAKAVAARAAVEGKVKLNYQFIEAAQKLGFVGPGLPGYGGSALYGQFGYNTSTVYGYNAQSLAQFADPFKLDLDQLFLQAFQLTEGAQAAGKEANAAFQTNIDRAATIALRRDAAIQLFKMIDGPSVHTQTTGVLKFGKGAPPTAPEPLPLPKGAAAGGSLGERWSNSAMTHCGQCHYGQNGEKKDGGFSLADYPKMDPEKQVKAIKLMLLPRDDPKHMPKDGGSVPQAEIQLWVEVMAANRPEPAALPKK